MTLELLKNRIRHISISHKQITDFDYGEDFLLATGKGRDYPLVFLEIPYNLSYEIPSNRFKSLQFALLVLMKPTNDAVDEDHVLISKSETIGDAIVTRFQKEAAQIGFIIDSVNGISLREFSDDNVQGFRFEITGRFFREYCSNNYADQFTV